MDAKDHILMFGRMRDSRSGWEKQWEDAAARIIPAHRNSFMGRGLDNAYGSTGQAKTEEMFDATAAIAAQRFMAVIESLNTPQASIWHRLMPADKMLKRNRAVRMYFDAVNDILFSHRYRPIGAFVANTQQGYQSLGAYGNFATFIDTPERVPGLRYRNIHLAEAYFKENHAGVIDTVYRSFFLTSRQAMQQFGERNPDIIKNQAKNSAQSENKHEFLHCVYPRDDYEPGRIDEKGKEFASKYISCTEQLIVQDGGFTTFPYATARYTQASGELYGRGPAQWVMPAIKTLNEQKKTVLKQGHRIVDPVLLAYDDGTMNTFSLRAGAVNAGGVSADGRPLVHVLPSGNLAVGDKMMEMERQVINDAFLITLFQILTENPQMTATEVLERTREKGMLIAPTAGRLQAEYLGPMINRELDLLSTQNLLPPMPAILREAGGSYAIEYDSPMSRMQRAEKASGFMRALNMAGEYVKATNDPEVLDHFDLDTAMPEVIDIMGSPIEWTRTPEAIEAIRAKRAKALENQQMLEAAPAAASMAKTMQEMPAQAQGA